MTNSIILIKGKNSNGFGSGFCVKNDETGSFFITCGHVINNCGLDICVDGLDAKVIKNLYADDLDLALIYVDNLKTPPMDVSLNSPRDSETVNVIGYSTLGKDRKKEQISNIKIKTGIIIEKRQKKIKAIQLKTSEPINSGYSGSPIINNKNQVIGVVNLKVDEATNYAIESEHLLELINLKEFTDDSDYYEKVNLDEIDDNKIYFINKTFNTEFEQSLKSFSSQSVSWIEPNIHNEPEEKKAPSNNKIPPEYIINSKQSFFIKSRHQYGATSLSHYLRLSALNKNNEFWLYLDAGKLKPHQKDIEKHIDAHCSKFEIKNTDIGCVILDEFSLDIKDANKIIDLLSDTFKKTKLIINYRVIDNPIADEELCLPRSFETIYLWPLERSDIRTLIKNYKCDSYIEENSKLFKKVINDIDALNIPRTAQNCLTLLKISEANFDDNPVNRTEMIRRILYLLFNVDNIPQYKTRPDLKDTEYTLGYFCEKILRSGNQFFTRSSFIDDINKFCKESEIELEIDIIFDILYENNIIIKRQPSYCFKFSYWIFYFAAHRMLQSKEFSEYILNDSHYISYPELIEFYTGVDRRRDDALRIIISDLNEIKDEVNVKCNFVDEFNIYDRAKWLPNTQQLEAVKDEVSNTVSNSNLPTELKDEYADRNYDPKKPLNQTIHKILDEYSLLRLMKGISAGSKALRNSDYAMSENRHELLEAIMNSCSQLNQALVAISPILARDGQASADGANFILTGNYNKDSFPIRFHQVIMSLPANIISWYCDDLFSQRMGLLMKNRLDQETDSLVKHYLHLILATKKPKEWNKKIESYIHETDKNSFYLKDLSDCLISEYRYGYLSNENIKIIKDLIKMTIAKHKLGVRKPNQKAINKIKDRSLPERLIE